MPATARCGLARVGGVVHPPPGKAALPALRASRATRTRALTLRVLQTAAPPAPTDRPVPPPAAKPAAAKDIDHVPLVLDELRAKKKVCIAQTAPAVRIAIGEELGLGPGVNATGKMVRQRAQAGAACPSAAAGPHVMLNKHVQLLLAIFPSTICNRWGSPCRPRVAKRGLAGCPPAASPLASRRSQPCAAWASTTSLVGAVRGSSTPAALPS